MLTRLDKTPRLTREQMEVELAHVARVEKLSEAEDLAYKFARYIVDRNAAVVQVAAKAGVELQDPMALAEEAQKVATLFSTVGTVRISYPVSMSEDAMEDVVLDFADRIVAARKRERGAMVEATTLPNEPIAGSKPSVAGQLAEQKAQDSLIAAAMIMRENALQAAYSALNEPEVAQTTETPLADRDSVLMPVAVARDAAAAKP